MNHFAGPSLEYSRDGGHTASTSGQDDLLVQKLMHRNASRLSVGSGVLSHRPSLRNLANPDGIVSLLPSGTEILFALGLDHRLALLNVISHRYCPHIA